MKRIVFVLSYQEGAQWAAQYPPERINEFFPQDLYTIIVLDNGGQFDMQQWCESTGNIWFPTENNLGTTGGYNWFIRAGAMLDCPRIAVLQADVVFRDSDVIDRLFVDENNNAWDRSYFAYYPNANRHHWTEEGHVPDVGQFFSLNPQFFLENDYLCDENYTVTHFESIDLWVRMVNTEHNTSPAIPVNLIEKYYTNPELTTHEQVQEDRLIYNFYHYSAGAGQHNLWYVYNFEYYQRKWRYNRKQLSGKIAAEMYKNGTMTGTMFHNPWGTVNDDGRYLPVQFHRRPLDVQRNINVGQLPYPVEHEVNRFYQAFVKTGICNSW
jgi:hypothetical protein